MEFKKLGWFWLRQDECEFCRRIRNLLAAIVGFTMFLVFGPRYAFLLGIHFTTFFCGDIRHCLHRVVLYQAKKRSPYRQIAQKMSGQITVRLEINQLQAGLGNKH